jgi:lycopene beta-cyclase
MSYDVDYLLVSGGLQSALIALALLQREPTPSIALVEREPSLGGNHTWCFHASDVPATARAWLELLVVQRWPAYDIIFPELRRTLVQPYAAISSQRLDAVVRESLEYARGCSIFLGCEVAHVEARAVTLVDGRCISARTVIDARGPAPGPSFGTGYQKFVGLEVRLERASSIARPIIMDLRTDQSQGLHFVYVLPFEPDRLLVEDTLFSESPVLDRAAMRRAALAYLEDAGLAVREVLREEAAVLLMPWASHWPEAADGAPLLGGVRGGWYHPGTGYSLPLAVRLASVVAHQSPDRLAAAVDDLRRRAEQQARFVRSLNWMFFRAVRPELRWRVMQRFYRLPDALISRYYALELSALDQARILAAGRPWRELRWPPRAILPDPQ